MLLEQHNLRTRVRVAAEDERTWLEEYLSFTTTAFRGAGRRPQQRTVSLLGRDATFPTGLLHHVREAAGAAGVDVQVRDARTAPGARDPGADTAWLRDYQAAAVDAVAAHTRGILHMPTGSGKTEVACALTLALPGRWGFLVHRAGLMDQAARRYEARTRCVAGRIAEGAWNEGDGAFTAATFQSVHAALARGCARTRGWLEQLDGLLVDEAHTLPADTFYRVAMATPNAYWRVGLSGTPLARGDRRSVLAVAALGPVIYRLRAEELVRQGVLARPRVRLLPVTHTNIRATTWQGVYGECVVRSPARNGALVAAAVAAERPALLFVKEVAHGRALERALGRAGLRADFVYGAHSAEHQRGVIHRLVQGALDVVVCSVVLQEGIDIPELRTVIVGSAGKSVIATLQRLGRGMRVERDAAGNVVKDVFTVIDVEDRGSPWLEKHTRARVRAYTGEGFETVVVPPSV